MITPKGRSFLTRYNTTCTELSRHTGISKTMIQRALAGTRNMSMEKVAAVSAYLGISIDTAMEEAFFHPHLRPAGNPEIRRHGFYYDKLLASRAKAGLSTGRRR